MKDNRSKVQRQTKEFSGLAETGVWVTLAGFVVGAVVSASGVGDGDSVVAGAGVVTGAGVIICGAGVGGLTGAGVG
jgi:hypothetical protein